jgi:predicted enzyme related to lactoylglutathione lyase
MFNYRVKNIDQLIGSLRLSGIQPMGEIQEFPYGKFAWLLDPEGNKIELWEPKDEGFELSG